MTLTYWAAALLSPRSVAPHPNFASTDLVTPQGLLALILQGRGHEAADASQRLETPLTASQAGLLEAAGHAFQGDTIREAAIELSDLVASANSDDPGVGLAASVLACLVLSEMDRHDEALALVATVHDSEILSTPDQDALLWKALLWQQQCMRLGEIGEDSSHYSADLGDLLPVLNPSEMSRFPTSQGSLWGPVGTMRQIVAAVSEAHREVVEAGRGFPDARQLRKLLRTQPSPLATQNLFAIRYGQTEYINELFRAMTMSREKIFRNEDVVDAPLWKGLNFFEICGNPVQAARMRGTLGKSRLLRMGTDATGHSTREGLRLLRHAGDVKSLKLALGHVRSRGPLIALRDEAASVIGYRLQAKRLRTVELSTLESAAQVLDQESAGEALQAVLDSIRPGATLYNRHELPALRIENALRAAAALAQVASRQDELARWVLESILAIGEIDDQLLSNAHQKGISSVDWDLLPAELVERWRVWASDPTPGWSSLAEEIDPVLRTQGHIATQPEQLTLGVIVAELNAAIQGTPAPPWLSTDAASFVGLLLDEMREDAARGMHKGYTVDPCDVAVGLIHYAAADLLWEPLVLCLTDPNVMRSAKSAAFERLAGRPEDVPGRIVTQLAGAMEPMLRGGEAGPTFFEEEELDPSPPALRLLAALEIIPSHELMLYVSQLGGGKERHRIEATRTLGTILSSQREVPDWAVASLLLMSSDRNAYVRAEAGRALAVALRRGTFAQAAIEERLNSLLDEDGLLVPLLLLRGIASSEATVSDRLRQRLVAISQSHMALAVREAAQEILDRSSA